MALIDCLPSKWVWKYDGVLTIGDDDENVDDHDNTNNPIQCVENWTYQLKHLTPKFRNRMLWIMTLSQITHCALHMTQTLVYPYIEKIYSRRFFADAEYNFKHRTYIYIYIIWRGETGLNQTNFAWFEMKKTKCLMLWMKRALLFFLLDQVQQKTCHFGAA